MQRSWIWELLAIILPFQIEGDTNYKASEAAFTGWIGTLNNL
jgi:hypothetical protein